MNAFKSSIIIILSVIVTWLTSDAFVANAATVWSGPPISFSHTDDNALQDQLTPGVALTRSSFGGGLYNAATESFASSGSSPDDTEWAIGDLADYSTLSYHACPLEAGNAPPGYVGTTFVVHLIKEDIYLSLTLTDWGGQGGAGEKTFAYTRTTPVPIIWNGPAISFSHTDENGLQDQLTPGVALTRSSDGGGLYNAATETYATSGVSPDDTEWAVGNLADYATLAYGSCPLEAGNYPPQYVGTTTFVVHLISENIYFSLALTGWGGAFSAPEKSFSYTRSTAFVAAPTPSISVTNPADGAVFAAPAILKLGASASVSSGTVTNVQFFANAISRGSVNVAPFNLNSGSLGAGSYALIAVATAAGISATSAVVNVSVVSPVTVSLSSAKLTGGQFTFSYAANSGLSYVVQTSTNLLNWVSLTTNVAASNPVLYTNTPNSTGARFYRVGRLPNP